MQRQVENLKEGATDAKDKAADALGNIKNQAADTLGNLKDQASDALATAKEKGGSLIDKLKDKASDNIINVCKINDLYGNSKENSHSVYGRMAVLYVCLRVSGSR